MRPDIELFNSFYSVTAFFVTIVHIGQSYDDDEGAGGRVFEMKKNDNVTRLLTMPAITSANWLLTLAYEKLPAMTPAMNKMR